MSVTSLSETRPKTEGEHLDRLSIAVATDPLARMFAGKAMRDTAWMPDHAACAAAIGYELALKDLIADFRSVGLTSTALYIAEFAALRGVQVEAPS